ncbi:chemotaxis regulatory protein ChePep [Helicobacter pylori]
MKMILFNQNPMITKLLESVSKKLELSMEDFNRYQELSTRLKEDPEWILIADDECLEKLDQVDWLELKETISQNKNSVCMYKKGNEVQPFLEGFEMKIKKPFLPTEVLKVLQKKLGFQPSKSDPNPTDPLEPTQEVLETNWDELENLGDLEALVQEEPNNEEQLLPTLNDQEEKEEVKEEEKEEVKEEEKEEVKEEEKEEVKEEEKEEVKETPQEEKPKDDETQEGETLKDEEVSKELETQEELEIPKEETQEQAKEQEPIKEETQENKEEKQEKTQDSPSVQELEAMQELVKEIQENSNGQEDKKETQENTETPQEKETQKLETPQEEIQENTEKTQKLETPQDVETPQETPQELEKQELETPQEEIQENTEKTQKLEIQEDHYESIEDIPEPVMAQAMGEELPFLNESVAKTSNNENDTETPKESVIKTPQEKEESDKTSSPLELRLNLQDLLKSLNQESLKSLLENKTLSIKITLEDKKPDA